MLRDEWCSRAVWPYWHAGNKLLTVASGNRSVVAAWPYRLPISTDYAGTGDITSTSPRFDAAVMALDPQSAAWKSQLASAAPGEMAGTAHKPGRLLDLSVPWVGYVRFCVRAVGALGAGCGARDFQDPKHDVIGARFMHGRRFS